MHLLLYDMGAYIQNDLMAALEEKKVTFKNILYKLDNAAQDAFFEKKVVHCLHEGRYDAVMSVNYWPILAGICKREGLPYIAWSYDSPMNVAHIEDTLGYDTNYVFLFDRSECEDYRRRGYTNVYHLPLAVNTRRLQQIALSTEERLRYGAQVSMVGEIYDSPLKELLEVLPDFDKGYLSSVVQSQLAVYGYNVIRNVMKGKPMDRINDVFRQGIGREISESSVHIWMAKQVTHIERLLLLETLGEEYQVKLYSSFKDPEMKNVQWEGSAGYFDEMPKVFKCSKINLNITLRCIETGIPLRALDIMGCGGFLLSNYQEELAGYFNDGEDMVLYHSLEDAIDKSSYYLCHEDERAAIAFNGYNKVKKYFTYEDKLEEMFRQVFGSDLNFL